MEDPEDVRRNSVRQQREQAVMRARAELKTPQQQATLNTDIKKLTMVQQGTPEPGGLVGSGGSGSYETVSKPITVDGPATVLRSTSGEVITTPRRAARSELDKLVMEAKSAEERQMLLEEHLGHRAPNSSVTK